LIISKQLLQTFSNDFAICTVTNFYADLELYFENILLEPDFKKLRRAANIKTFHEIKNFLFTSFFWFEYSLSLAGISQLIFNKTHIQPAYNYSRLKIISTRF